MHSLCPLPNIIDTSPLEKKKKKNWYLTYKNFNHSITLIVGYNMHIILKTVLLTLIFFTPFFSGHLKSSQTFFLTSLYHHTLNTHPHSHLHPIIGKNQHISSHIFFLIYSHDKRTYLITWFLSLIFQLAWDVWKAEEKKRCCIHLLPCVVWKATINLLYSPFCIFNYGWYSRSHSYFLFLMLHKSLLHIFLMLHIRNIDIMLPFTFRFLI